MASFMTRIQRMAHSHKRVLAVLLFIALLIIVYKQHSIVKANSLKGFQSDVRMPNKDVAQQDDIVVDSQENPRAKKHYGYDDDEHEFKNDKLHNKLQEFQSEINSLSLQTVPDDITEDHNCPACYGTSICSDIESGRIKIHIPDKSTREKIKGAYFGKWEPNGVIIVLKTLGSPEEFEKFDSYICEKTTGKGKCDVSDAIVNRKSPIMKESAFHPRSLFQTKRIIGREDDQLAFTSCATSDLMSELSRAYDNNRDNKLTSKEIATYYFSSVINPEPVLLQFINKFKGPLPVPKYLGSCGRAIIVEGVGQTLDNFLMAEWSMRVDLALQLFDFIDLFVNGDPDWGVMFADFHFDNFAVNEDGQLVVIDLEDIAILDKNSQVEAKPDLPCNWECLKNYMVGVLDIDNPQHRTYCSQVMDIGSQLMYFFACQLLSDKPKHKVSFQDQDGEELTTGLLRNPPKKQQDDLYGYLDECVVETTAGGRMDAVESLKQLLETWAYGDDDADGAINDGADDNSEEDDDQEDDKDYNNGENMQ